jgi:hypothetical protein
MKSNQTPKGYVINNFPSCSKKYLLDLKKIFEGNILKSAKSIYQYHSVINRIDEELSTRTIKKKTKRKVS